MTAQHPLTTLSIDELPGWIAAMRHVGTMLAPATIFTIGDIRSRVVEMQTIAEGLLANADAAVAEEEDAQEGLADEVAEHVGAKVPPPVAASAETPPRGIVWTEARKELLRREYPDPRFTVAEILQHVNGLEGPPCTSVASVRQVAKTIGLQRAPKSAEEPAPTAPAVPEEDMAEARQMILDGKGAKDLTEEFGWNLGHAQSFAARVRAEAAP